VAAVLSLQRTEAGEDLLAPISRRAFLPSLSRELPTLLGTNPHEVTKSSKDEVPPHVRTLPSMRSGFSRSTHQQVLGIARGISRLMTVPRGGSAELTAQVLLEDIQAEHRHCASRPAGGG
jgi:hypothetical protein